MTSECVFTMNIWLLVSTLLKIAEIDTLSQNSL